MSRAAAHQPDVLHPGMAIHDKVRVWCLLVLANTRFDERRILQGREAECEIFADLAQQFLTDHSLAGSRIEGRATRVVGDLESAPSVSGYAVEEAVHVVAPDWKMPAVEAVVARWQPEEKHVLLSRTYQLSNRVGKHCSQPWPASEDVMVRFQSRTIGQHEISQRRALEPFRQHRALHVLPTLFDKRIDYSLATGAGIEVSAIRFVDSPDHIREVDLRPARLHLAGRKFFVANPRTPQAIDRAALEGIIPLGRHPQNAGAVQAPAFPPALGAGPELERPCRLAAPRGQQIPPSSLRSLVPMTRPFDTRFAAPAVSVAPCQIQPPALPALPAVSEL